MNQIASADQTGIAENGMSSFVAVLPMVATVVALASTFAGYLLSVSIG